MHDPSLNPRFHHCVHVKFSGKPLPVFAKCGDCGATWELVFEGKRVRGWERTPLLGKTKKYTQQNRSPEELDEYENNDVDTDYPD